MGLAIAGTRINRIEDRRHRSSPLGRGSKRSLRRRSPQHPGSAFPVGLIPHPLKYDVILFDDAETLFTTRGTVGEIYAEVVANYGSRSSADDIQYAFLQQFQHSGPLRPENEKQWWKDVVHGVFSTVG